MYLASNPDQALAAMDLSAGVFPGGTCASLVPPVCIELYVWFGVALADNGDVL